MSDVVTVEVKKCGSGFTLRWKAESVEDVARRGYWSEGDEDGKQAVSDWEDALNSIAVIVGRCGLTLDPDIKESV